MAPTDGGTVLVTVEAEGMAQFEAQFNSRMQAIATTSGRAFADRFAESFGRSLSNQLVEEVQMATQRAQRAMRPIRVEVDTTVAERELQRLVREREARIRVIVEGNEAERQLKKIAKAGGASGKILAGILLSPALIPTLAVAATATIGLTGALAGAGAALGVFGGVAATAVTEVKEQDKKFQDLNDKIALYQRIVDQTGHKTVQLANAQEELRARMSLLPPEQRKAVAGYRGMIDAWTEFTDKNKPVVFTQLGRGYELIKRSIPDLQPLFNAGATAVRKFLTAAEDWQKVGGLKDMVSFLSRNAQTTLPSLGRIFRNIASGVGALFTETEGSGQGILDWLENITGKFKNWTSNGGLDKLLQYAKDNGPAVVTMMEGLATNVGIIVQVLTPFAPISLAIVTALSAIINIVPVDVMTAIVGLWIAWGTAVKIYGIWMLLASTYTTIMAAATAALNFVMAMNPIGLVVLAIIALVAIFIVAYKKSDKFKAIVDGAFKVVKAGAKALWEGIKWAFGKIKEGFQFLMDKARDAKTAIGNAWQGIQDKIKAGKERIIGWLRAIKNFITQDVPNAFRDGAKAVGEKWKALQDLCKIPIKFVIETVINKGLIDTFNSLIGKLHLPGGLKIGHVPLPKGFKTGGYVSGPGTGTSDSIPARLSNGEFVLKKKAVDKIGVNVLNKLNIAGDPSGMVVKGYADGGLVSQVRNWLPSVDPKPYVWGAVGPNAYDCSGLVGEVYRMLTGRGGYGRVMTTSSNFSSLGFRRGKGTFTMGVNPGTHMAGNLGGTAFEAASTKSGIHVGGSARSVNNFAQQWYLPQIGDQFVGGGGGHGGISVIDQAKKGLADIVRNLGSFMNGAPAGIPGEFMYGAVEGVANKIENMDISDLFKGIAGKAWNGIKGGAGAVKDFFFDQGGLLMPGSTMVRNATGQPEQVLTQAQWSDISTLAGVGGGSGATVDRSIHIAAEYRELVPTIRREQQKQDFRESMLP